MRDGPRRQDKSVRMLKEQMYRREEEEWMDESRRDQDENVEGLQLLVERRDTERRVYSDGLASTIASFSLQLSFIFGQKEQEE